jgi:hypothetical protein
VSGALYHGSASWLHAPNPRAEICLAYAGAQMIGISTRNKYAISLSKELDRLVLGVLCLLFCASGLNMLLRK